MSDPLTGAALALGIAIVWVCIGELIGSALPFFRRISLPGAVPGGLLALACGPQMLSGSLSRAADAVAGVYDTLAHFPSLFISVVFACLMLGRPLASPSTIWRRARPHVVMGHVIAWGQYVVGVATVLFVLAPVFEVDRLAGPLIAVGFQGGHGTAAGLASTFNELGFAEGETLALAVATVGVLAGTVGGPLLAMALTRRASTDGGEGDASPEESGASGAREDSGEETGEFVGGFRSLTGRLTLHLGLVALVIGAAALLLRGLEATELALRPDAEMIVSRYVPLFSVVLITGLGMQAVLQRLRCAQLFDRGIFQRVGNFALDMVIVSALATLSLGVISRFWVPVAVLCLGGLAWNLTVFFVLAPRLFPSDWAAHGLGDLGGGTATTATGLLLIRTADPHERTSARSAYVDKQPFYEPLMGGGLVTALALPTVAVGGPITALGISGAVLIGWLVYAAAITRARG